MKKLKRMAAAICFLGVFGLSLFSGQISATTYCTGIGCVGFITAWAIHETDQPWPDPASCLANCF